MNTIPSIVLVHGFWSGAAQWSKVILQLGHKGHTSILAVELPLTSLADDIERTRKMVAQIPGPVLLVGHSYGGAVITEVGNLANVVGLVFIAAFAPDAGESPASITQRFPPEALPNLDSDSDGYLWINRSKFHQSFCQDLSAEDAFALAATQKAPLARTFADAITNPSWKHQPCWYQISSDDRMISPENQEQMALKIAPLKILSLRTSHASLIARPREISELVHEAATKLSEPLIP